MATTMGIAPSSVSAGTSTPAGMRMSQMHKSSARAVILTHRRTVHVAIHNLAFGPKRIVVSPGTTIVWTNQDGFQHTSTSDHGLWDSGPINPNASFTHVFKTAGTFTYHCTIHPFMLGTITVAK